MSMNIFRLAGDMSHVFSIIILLLRLKVAKNANGACGVHVGEDPSDVGKGLSAGLGGGGGRSIYWAEDVWSRCDGFFATGRRIFFGFVSSCLLINLQGSTYTPPHTQASRSRRRSCS